MSSLNIVQTDGAPEAIGPYSQAIVSGGWVFCSGQIALDPATGDLVAGGVEAQAERVLKSLAAVLEAAGSSMSQVVKTTIFLADMGDFAIVNEIYGRHFRDHRPARATVEVSRLPKDVAVEIECTARVA